MVKVTTKTISFLLKLPPIKKKKKKKTDILCYDANLSSLLMLQASNQGKAADPGITKYSVKVLPVSS